MTTKIRGVFHILATPFDPGGALDEASLRRLLDFQIARGAHGFTILGVLGEAAKLSVEERRRVVEIVLEQVTGRVPVVVGTSHPDVETCILLSQDAVAAGADGVMIAPPPFDHPVRDGDAVLAYYARVADAYADPIVVQDFPPVNNVTLSPDFLAQLADRIPNARHLKLEDPPLMQKISAILARTDKYLIFGGLGGMFFLEELLRGAAGTMTGFAFTEILVAVYDAINADQFETAARIFDHYLPLIRFENQPVINLSIRKQLLHLRGAIAHSGLRAPFAPLDEGTQVEITAVLARVGIADPAAHLTFDALDAPISPLELQIETE